jgi:hypothetical protein
VAVEVVVHLPLQPHSAASVIGLVMELRRRE